MKQSIPTFIKRLKRKELPIEPLFTHTCEYNDHFSSVRRAHPPVVLLFAATLQGHSLDHVPYRHGYACKLQNIADGPRSDSLVLGVAMKGVNERRTPVLLSCVYCHRRTTLTYVATVFLSLGVDQSEQLCCTHVTRYRLRRLSRGPLREALGDDQCGALGDDQCGALGDDQCGALGDDQCGALGDDQCGALGDDQFGALGDDQCGALGDDQCGALGDDMCGALGDDIVGPWVMITAGPGVMINAGP
ncbi:hypothetical protein Btru_061474 [Bulinus truncatus]|nr:hypothetical protein Btru_061474 [Bulinus truncatus]